MTEQADEATGGPGRLLVISGPSAVGKDTVLKKLFELFPAMRYSVSYTTRPSREGEVNGVDYNFVDKDTFLRMKDDGEFLETAEVHGNWYGTSLKQVNDAIENGETLALIIDVQGAANIRNRVSNATFVFLLPPTFEVLEQRLLLRGSDKPDDVKLRLDNARYELEQAPWFDYRIVNDNVEDTANEILRILRSYQRLNA